jgi:hypothetical protein
MHRLYAPLAAGLSLALGLLPTLSAQQSNQRELQRKRSEKLAKPVFKQAAWLTDFAAAKKQASEQRKLILVYFTRSYAT